ncbi:hypothetical protein DVH24_023106 [Malus domestica]|uniref:Uncharacterized protein n=1 Tax=Malus domestica TaxID=3750 RepID=A0A498KTD4_MALDO|nr:hypothetical protein DVH24_023106 [Malus domestica]
MSSSFMTDDVSGWIEFGSEVSTRFLRNLLDSVIMGDPPSQPQRLHVSEIGTIMINNDQSHQRWPRITFITTAECKEAVTKLERIRHVMTRPEFYRFWNKGKLLRPKTPQLAIPSIEYHKLLLD